MLHNLLAFFNVVLPPFITSMFPQVLHLSTSFSHSLLVLYKPLEVYIRGVTWVGFFWLVFGC
jgi:hypothetical protein